MRKFLKLRSELNQHLSDVAREKAQLDYSVTMTKQKVHNKLTSTKTLVSSFAVGAVTGWFASAGKESDIELELGDDSANNAKVSVSAKSPSNHLDLINHIKALGVSLLMAEITKKATALVDSATQTDTSSDESKSPLKPTSVG